MCLAVPYTIKQINGNDAQAETGGVTSTVRLDLIDSPKTGDVVLVHAGFAIQRIEKKDADELQSLWAEVETNIS